MNRRKRILVILGSIALATTACIAFQDWQGGRMREKEMAAAAPLLQQLRHDLPDGTTRDVTDTYLDTHKLVHTIGSNDSYVTLLRWRSNLWYCSYEESDAVLKFDGGAAQASLHSIDSAWRGDQCL